MNRRILVSLAALCLFTILSAVPAHAQKDKRPNILFAFADDWGRYASAYAKLEPGGPSDILSTPNFDKIAKNGWNPLPASKSIEEPPF